MTSNTETERVVGILCAHRSQELGPDDVGIVPDPQIIDLYAARVWNDAVRGGGGGDGDDYLVRSSGGSVEEVRFNEWPPQRRAFKGTETGPHAKALRARDGGPNTRRGAMRIEEVMCRDVYHCRPEDSLASAARLMWEHDCGCAPVCEGDGEQRVVGMITDRDIAMCALFQGRRLDDLKVRDAMSRGVSACHPEDVSFTVEQLMRDRQIRRVPVTDMQERLVGIVSLADLVREAAPGEEGTSSAYITDSEIADTLAAICEPSESRAMA